MYTYMCIYVYMYTCIHAYMHTCIHVYYILYLSIFVYIYIYIERERGIGYVSVAALSPTTPRGGEALHVCLRMSRAKHPI